MYLRPVSRPDPESEPLAIMNSRAVKFFESYFAADKPTAPASTDASDFKINVDTASSRVATFYEKIRQVVDWKEEHLMRRIAMERVLKRRLFLKHQVTDTAESLLIELVRGGHFPNNFISRARVQPVQEFLDRYHHRLRHLPTPPVGHTKSATYDLVFKIAACELEELLNPQDYAHAAALVDFMEKTMHDKIVIGPAARDKYPLKKTDREVMLFISVQQALLRLDYPTIAYNILKRYSPEWFSSKTEIQATVTDNIYTILKNIDTRFYHPLAHKFFAACQNYSPPFLILNDALRSGNKKIYQNASSLKSVMTVCRQAYDQRLKLLQARLRRSAIYTTISVFATHIVLLYILEIPLAQLLTSRLHLLAAAVDIFVPTILMGVLVAGIRLPAADNFDLIFTELQKILYKNNELGFCEIEIYRQKSWLWRAIMRFWYGLNFIVCFGLLIALLYWLNFPITSYFVFIIFTSLIFFTGSVLRQNSQELNMCPRKEGLIALIFQPLTLPIVYLGRWLSGKWQKYNLAGIFFSVLLDSPFAVFINFIEQWRHFVREKQEEIH